MHKQRALLACVVSNRAAKSLPSPAPTITTLFDDFDAPDPIADCIQAGAVINSAHTWAILLVRCIRCFPLRSTRRISSSLAQTRSTATHNDYVFATKTTQNSKRMVCWDWERLNCPTHDLRRTSKLQPAQEMSPPQPPDEEHRTTPTGPQHTAVLSS